MKTSDLYQIDIQDLGKGLVVATGGAVVAALQTALTTTPFILNWHNIGLTALAAGISYLAKNFFTKPSMKTPLNN